MVWLTILLLICCLVGCRDQSVPVSTATKAHQIQVNDEGSYFTVYTADIDGKTYYVTLVHNGICIGPEVKKGTEK